jgi:hypothetical protein
MSFKIGGSYDVGKISYTVELEPDSLPNSNWYKITTAEIVAPSIHVFYSQPAGIAMLEIKGQHELSMTYKTEFNTLVIPESAVEELKNGCLVRLWRELRLQFPLAEDSLDYIEDMIDALENLIKAKI